MNQNNIELRLLVKGKPISEYYHNGSIFVEGREGSPYEIEITNRNPHRVEAIISVDGLSIIDGKEASDTSAGYLLNAHETIRVPGWKLDDRSVAAFVFGGKGGSYAAQSTGSARNTGVIGVMAFREQAARVHINSNGFYGASPFPQDMMGYSTCGGTLSMAAPSGAIFRNASNTLGGHVETFNAVGATATSLRSATGSRTLSKSAVTASVNNLGTGFGEQTEYATHEVSFNRGDLHCMSVLYYDNARGLKARGIQVSRPSRTRYNQQPQAFPGMSRGCTPPPGWNG